MLHLRLSFMYAKYILYSEVSNKPAGANNVYRVRKYDQLNKRGSPINHVCRKYLGKILV